MAEQVIQNEDAMPALLENQTLALPPTPGQSEAGTYGWTVGFDRHFEILLSGHFLIDCCSSFPRKGFADLIWIPRRNARGGRHCRVGWRASKMGSLSETGGKR